MPLNATVGSYTVDERIAAAGADVGVRIRHPIGAAVVGHRRDTASGIGALRVHATTDPTGTCG